MDRKEALKKIVELLPKDIAVISTLGLISRELFRLLKSDQIFYMTGSMGLAPSIGLGVALCKRGLKVLIIDGDGSLLINLGSMVTNGFMKPSNLVHLVLDNSAYASCSEEPTYSSTARFDKIARIVGYREIFVAKDLNQLTISLRDALRKNNGPYFILVKMELGGDRNLPRILDLKDIAKDFKAFLARF